MTTLNIPDLSLPQLLTGTHCAGWDLKTFLYKGAAQTSRRLDVIGMIAQGVFGRLLVDRLPLVIKIHEYFETRLISGSSHSTINSNLGSLARFVCWADDHDRALTLESVRAAFVDWQEHYVHRVRIKKNITESSAYAVVHVVSKVLSDVLGYPSNGLSTHIRLRGNTKRKTVLGLQADKQNLTDVFVFGHVLTDICTGLTYDAIRGELPVTIALRNGHSVTATSNLKRPDMDLSKIQQPNAHSRAFSYRAPLAIYENIIDDRRSLINLRIQAEMLIFIAQTSMNPAQAKILRQEQYRWKRSGTDDVCAFRVYKGRRHGEAIFRCFSGYREHLQRYIDWLNAIGLTGPENHLFPFISRKAVVPSRRTSITFYGVSNICKQANVKLFTPRILRRTRVNWFLRKSKDPSLTAQQAAHSKETMFRNYEQPHFATAAMEILRFHTNTDRATTPPGPGQCANISSRAMSLSHAPTDAPEPDCVSPDGCLFCAHHRDVMSYDYCWKLASHRHLKSLEVSLYRPPNNAPPHPAQLVIDRIGAKLDAIGLDSEDRLLWIRDACDSVRSGQFHPMWESHIELFEEMQRECD